MKIDDLREKLEKIEIALARIDVHLNDIKTDVKETKEDTEQNKVQINELEKFKSKIIGMATIVVPVIAFFSALGHDLIKRFMGW